MTMHFTGRYLSEFIQNQYKRSDLYLHEIRLGFIQRFHSFLLSEKLNRQNSCAKHLKFLKQLLNIAVGNGYIQFNPLNLYKVEHETVDIDFLDDVELRKIINFTTPLKRFERTRDAFLFGCALQAWHTSTSRHSGKNTLKPMRKDESG